MEMREWLSVIVIIAIVLIMLDGFRRKLIERKNRVRIKLDKNIPHEDDDFDYERNAELPSGGARIVARDGSDEGSDENSNFTEEDESSEQDLDIEGNDPVLMDSVDIDRDGDKEEETVEDVPLDSVDDFDSDNATEDEETVISSDERIEPSLGDNDILETDTSGDSQGELLLDGKDENQDEDFEEISHGASNDEQSQEAQEVIVMNVVAKNERMFAGSELLPVLMAQGMQLGDMSIFHRYADSNGNGPIIFSMANIMQPGTFEMSQIEDFETPGVSFFLQLPLPKPLDNMQGFEKMLDAANAIKNSLGGELKDEDKVVITPQAIEHCRQRIRDFELEQLSKK